MVTYITSGPFLCNQPFPHHPPNPRHQFLSSHCSHFPERFQGIMALTNHPLGSGAHEIDVPSFQNNRCALWEAWWCHNFSSWQARQVCFGPRMGTGPMKTQSGQLNLLVYWGRWQDYGVSSHQTCSITFSVLNKLTTFTRENQASLSPWSWVILHCLSEAISLPFPVQQNSPNNIKEIQVIDDKDKTKRLQNQSQKLNILTKLFVLWLST